MKLNREQVIKALECCSKTNCKGCPYTPNGKNDIFDITCSINMSKDALSLIKELTEENERLKLETGGLYSNIVLMEMEKANIKADTVRKMKERVRAHFDDDRDIFKYSHNYIRCVIDQIAKEMLEEGK